MTWTWRDSGLLAAGAVGRLVDAQRVNLGAAGGFIWPFC